MIHTSFRSESSDLGLVVLDGEWESVYGFHTSQKRILLWSTQSDFLYFHLNQRRGNDHQGMQLFSCQPKNIQHHNVEASDIDIAIKNV